MSEHAQSVSSVVDVERSCRLYGYSLYVHFGLNTPIVCEYETCKDRPGVIVIAWCHWNVPEG